jgi:hypothetical protein
MPIAKDIWRPLLLDAPIETILRSGTIDGHAHRWLPAEQLLCFLADPFGLVRDDRLHVFVEHYDYRTRHGTIECLLYDTAFALVERRRVLTEPWHLSYPFVFEAEGATWMLPEAHRSGGLTLYRAEDFPWRWVPAARLTLDHVAVDATPVFHQGLWWLFYASADRATDKTGALFVSCAERLTGPWRPHPGNPLRRDPAGSRPGGTPVMIDGRLVLPVQDCSRTYGGAIRPLWIDALTPDSFAAEAGTPIAAPAVLAPFDQGLHTLSAIGGRTLVDVKRTLLSPRSLAVLARRELRRR